MSQNDYTIANQAFPAFRADLNSALQAIATNNSGTTAPSTMFANMWWYDSANNILYIRNEDNDAWIKFAELDQTNDKFILSGTLQLDDGSASAPALTFNSDTNMGLYRGGTDILKFVTAGADAVTIDASQNVGIGVVPEAWQSTRSALQVGDSTAVWGDGSKNSWFTNNVYRNSSNNEVYINASYASEITMTNGGIINFKVAPSGSADATIGWTTAMTIDNSGNVGIGTSSPASPIHGKGSASTGVFGNVVATLEDSGGDYPALAFKGTSGHLFAMRSIPSGGLVFADTSSGSSFDERMKIDSSGNVSIGTGAASTYVGLVVNGGTDANLGPTIYLSKGGTSFGVLSNYGRIQGGTSSDFFIATTTTNNLLLGTNNTERMRITSAGHVLINTSSKISADQGQGFAVHADTSSAGSCMEVKNTGNPASNRDFIRFYNTSNGEAGSIEHNGTSSVAYLTSSDYRLKENVVTEWDATTRLKQLKPSRFNFIADADRTVDGFLAHEVQAIVPEAISGAKDALDADGNAVMQGIDQSKLVPLLVKTIQELEARITALENGE